MPPLLVGLLIMYWASAVMMAADVALTVAVSVRTLALVTNCGALAGYCGPVIASVVAGGVLSRVGGPGCRAGL
jgi:hypothetical protein